MKLIKVGAAVLNQTPLDWDGNAERIRAAIEDARARSVSLLCLPELCITGHGCEDSFQSPAVQRTALAVLRGGPTAATDLLARETEGAVIDAMYPDFSDGLRGDAFEILTAAVAAASGFDLGALARDVSRQAGRAIFLAIGREEAEIRRNPRATRDPVLIALLGG